MPWCGRVSYARGGITEELKETNRQRVRTEMREGTAHMRHVTETLDCSECQRQGVDARGHAGESPEHEVQSTGHVRLNANDET